MRIVQLAPLEETIPPVKYGGTELVVYNLTEEMVKKGHEVFLLASGDSKTSASLVPISPASLRNQTGNDRALIDALKNVYIAKILQKIQELKPDIVHNHQERRFIPFTNLVSCPVVSTIHGPVDSSKNKVILPMFTHANYVSISNNQRLGGPNLNWIKTIYNGIDVSRFSVGTGQRDYFAFLGRTSPEKGLFEVCQIIKKTNFKLKIAAKVDSVDKEYFENKVKPFIDGKQIEFIGEVDHQGKVQLLKNARALLAWLNWEEPFGMFVIEAMACGTPVIINPRGSMPEIIVDKKTGFLVNSLEEMQKQLNNVAKINPKNCREHVENNFSSEKMAENYLELFSNLIK